MLKLGKKPARKDAVKLKLADYIDKSAFPALPKSFGHETLIGTKDWGMLGNDKYGDCVWAAKAHMTMLWNKANGRNVSFTEKSVLSDYSAVTGFNPNDPNSDQGTDMQEAASYHLKTGILDADGKRHKIGAYLAITPGDLKEHYIAMYLFGAMEIGIQVPSYVMDLFNQGKPWVYRSKHSIEGGHDIPLVAKRSHIDFLTWSALAAMSVGFFNHFNDESIAILSEEYLTQGISPEKFNLAQLRADLAAL